MKLIPKKPFTWILVIFAVYIYATYPGTYKVPEQIKDILPSSKQKITATTEKTSFFEKPANTIMEKMNKTETGRAIVNAIKEQAIKKKLGNMDIYAAKAQEDNKLYTIDRLKGKGESAKCGSIVTLHYEFFISDVIKIDSSIDRKSPLTFEIGQRQTIRALEQGILGMKKGGERKIAAPSHLAFDDHEFKSDLISAGEPLMIDVTMLDIKNGQDSNATMMTQDKIIGDGDEEVFCGSKVTIAYRILKNGTTPEQNTLSFTVGDNSVPIGFEKGILGMKSGGIKELTIPQELLKIYGKSILPEDLKFPDSGNVVVEFELY